MGAMSTTAKEFRIKKLTPTASGIAPQPRGYSKRDSLPVGTGLLLYGLWVVNTVAACSNGIPNDLQVPCHLSSFPDASLFHQSLSQLFVSSAFLFQYSQPKEHPQVLSYHVVFQSRVQSLISSLFIEA